MMRFMLALLAMLSGICALGQPVAARAVGQEASAEQRIDCVVAAESVAEQVLTGISEQQGRNLRDGGKTLKPIPSVVLPRTVRIRCDRALE